MSETSRRKFLITAGAGAAVAAAATAGVVKRSGDPAAAGGATGTAAALPKNAKGPLVAYVHDVKAGQVAVMVGESEVVVTDHALVSRLLAVRTGQV